MKKRFFMPVFIVIVLYGCGEVSVPGIDGPQIVSFTFPAAENYSLSTDVPAVISGTSITAELPADADLTGLVPRFSLSEGALSVPVSGAKTNFTRTVFYYISSDDGTDSTTYTVDVFLMEPE